MRTFIALEIPKTIKNEVQNNQRKLEKTGLQAKWVKPKNLHLTLAFLGSTKTEAGKPLNQILKISASQTKPFRLHFLKIDAFPDPAQARVLFLDLGGEKDKLRALASRIRKQLKKEGIGFDEKKFQAHLTLGRLKRKQNVAALIRQTKIKPISFEVKKISLIKSQLAAAGPFYTPLKSLPMTP